jgi:hypothetical protein
VPQFTVDAHRAVGDFDVFGVSFSTELGYTNMLTALDLAGIPLHADERDRRATRSSSPAATPPSTPSRSPTSSTPPSSATARRRCCDHRHRRRVEAEGMPGGRREICS